MYTRHHVLFAVLAELTLTPFGGGPSVVIAVLVGVGIAVGVAILPSAVLATVHTLSLISLHLIAVELVHASGLGEGLVGLAVGLAVALGAIVDASPLVGLLVSPLGRLIWSSIIRTVLNGLLVASSIGVSVRESLGWLVSPCVVGSLVGFVIHRGNLLYL